MFLDWLAQLNFFQHDDESSVFIPFPKEIRKEIAYQVISHLLRDENANYNLSSKRHMMVIMEIIGQTFNLEISEEKLIRQAISLYRGWINGDITPPPMTENRELFIITICQHFSLLFAERSPTSVNIHVSLCLEVLEIFDNEFRGPSSVSLATWESILKILLGISDHLCSLPETNNNLSNALCPHLLKTLFSLWIRSNVTNGDMWDKLKELITGWRHRLPVIMQWIATSSGLTNTMLNLLYVSHAPKGQVIFQSIGTSEIIEIDQSYILFSWYRMLHILGDLETLEQPTIYFEALKGIHHLCRQFYQVLNIKSTKVMPPDGNSILHIFGPFLFNSILNIKEEFAAGKAEAFTAILQLIISKHETNFENVYLSSLYAAIEQGLKSSNTIVDAILINSSSIFSCGLKGVRILIPSYWLAVQKILRDINSKTARMSSELVLACYKISSHFLSLSSIYNDVKVGDLCKGINLSTELNELHIKNFENISNILLDCFMREYSDGNKLRLLSILFTFVWENAGTIHDFPYRFISQITTIMIDQKWAPSIVLKFLKAWKDFAGIYTLIKKENKVLPHFLVDSLCNYLDFLFFDKENIDGMNEALIIAIYECLQSWVMQGQWLIKNQKTLPKNQTQLYKVLKYAFIGKTGKNSHEKDSPTINIISTSEKIPLVANYLINLILNKMDNYPASSGSTDISCYKSENDIISTMDAKKYSIFVLDSSLVTLINHPRDDQGKFEVTTIVRDMTGKYVWNSKFECFEDPIDHQIQRKSCLNTYITASETAPGDAKLLENLMIILADDEKHRHDLLVGKVQDRINLEKQALISKNYGFDVDVKINIPSKLQTNPAQDQAALRNLSLQLGWNSLFYRTRMYNIKEKSSSLESLLKEIDCIKERDCFTLGVFYIPSDGNNEKSIFACFKPSAAFEDFAANLGWEVDLNNHTGFSGNLNPKATGNTAIYFANYENEIIFHVAVMMSSHSHTALMYKRRHLLSNRVLIVWVEANSFKPFEFVRGLDVAIVIAIFPLSPLLYKVKLYKKYETYDFGPIEDETTITKHALASIIRLTATNAMKSCTDTLNYHNQMKRFNAIDNLIKSMKHECSINEYYAKLMCT